MPVMFRHTFSIISTIISFLALICQRLFLPVTRQKYTPYISLRCFLPLAGEGTDAIFLLMIRLCRSTIFVNTNDNSTDLNRK